MNDLGSTLSHVSGRPDGTDWQAAYERLVDELPSIVASSRLTICGNNACVDASVSLSRIAGVLIATPPDSKAGELTALLLDRAARGVGGEVRLEWDEGALWLGRHVAPVFSMGGTGPQAAWSLAVVGAPAVMALEDRSAHMLRLVHPDISIAGESERIPARDLDPIGVQRPDTFIFEYRAGEAIGPVTPTRSSRVIVRFADNGLEHDPLFDALTPHLARTAGAGLISGLGVVDPAVIDGEIDYVLSGARRWRAAGLAVLHLELADFGGRYGLEPLLTKAQGVITSLGLSLSEFRGLRGGVEERNLPAAMALMAEEMGLGRLCVHADGWAASVTLGDPDVEFRALMMGCLLAASRAAAGAPAKPEAVPAGARFEPLPFDAGMRVGAYRFVACASPYLVSPATTLGLGDTFTAGCLLVLGAS